jgi:hypothetical protein
LTVFEEIYSGGDSLPKKIFSSKFHLYFPTTVYKISPAEVYSGFNFLYLASLVAIIADA